MSDIKFGDKVHVVFKHGAGTLDTTVTTVYSTGNFDTTNGARVYVRSVDSVTVLEPPLTVGSKIATVAQASAVPLGAVLVLVETPGKVVTRLPFFRNARGYVSVYNIQRDPAQLVHEFVASKYSLRIVWLPSDD